MERIRRYRPSPGTAFGFAALVIALGGVAFAAIPDSNGTIHACFQKNGGAVRVVESAAECRSAEQALAWNQRGPQGATGATGPQGIPGSGAGGSDVAYARIGDVNTPGFSHSKNVIGVERIPDSDVGGYDECWDLTAPAVNVQTAQAGNSGVVAIGGEVPPRVASICPAPFDDASSNSGGTPYFALFQLAPSQNP
jgi:hypothetical protein